MQEQERIAYGCAEQLVSKAVADETNSKHASAQKYLAMHQGYHSLPINAD